MAVCRVEISESLLVTEVSKTPVAVIKAVMFEVLLDILLTFVEMSLSLEVI